MLDERRKHRRKKVNSRVKVFHPVAGSFESETKDISNGGILISATDCTDKIQEKDEAKVIFLNSGDVDIIFNMTVVRVSKNEIAMEIMNCEREGEVFSVSDLRDIQR